MLEAAEGAAHYADADTPGFCWAGRELVLGLANDPDVVPSKARKTATMRATGRWPSRVEAASLIYKDAWVPDRPELRSSVLFTPQCDGWDLSFFV